MDFWIVRQQKLKIPDLYTKDGIYWYQFGWNWRAFVSFFVAIFPSMPGFVCAVNGDPIAVGWTRLYQLSYFIGITIAGLLYWTLCKFFPPPGLGIQQQLDEVESINGVEIESPASSSVIDMGRKDEVSEKVMQV
jgi:NCS1 family nucleobase:cation symporter-1